MTVDEFCAYRCVPVRTGYVDKCVVLSAEKGIW